jgi:hypothetical protein
MFMKVSRLKVITWLVGFTLFSTFVNNGSSITPSVQQYVQHPETPWNGQLSAYGVPKKKGIKPSQELLYQKSQGELCENFPEVVFVETCVAWPCWSLWTYFIFVFVGDVEKRKFCGEDFVSDICMFHTFRLRIMVYGATCLQYMNILISFWNTLVVRAQRSRLDLHDPTRLSAW